MHQKRHNRKRSAKTILLAASMVVLLCSAVGGTLAWLIDTAGPLVNIFNPAEVTCSVEETPFDGQTKQNVQIKNTGDVSAYIRAYYIVTWKNAQGQVYGKAPDPDSDYALSMGSGWSLGTDGFYYYPTPVLPEGTTANFISKCELKEGADIPEGYHLSVEIIAEAIQSQPIDAVTSAWPGGPYLG